MIYIKSHREYSKNISKNYYPERFVSRSYPFRDNKRYFWGDDLQQELLRRFLSSFLPLWMTSSPHNCRRPPALL